MIIHAQKQNQPQQQSSPSITRSSAKSLAASHVVHPIMRLQRTIGNRAVLKLLRANAEGLEVGSDTSATTLFAHDFGRIPVNSKTPVKLQAKLKVNTPGDSYEQEADRISEQVMSMSEPHVQRASACGGQCPTCQNEQAGHEHLQKKPIRANNTGEISAPPIVNEVLRLSVQPLDVVVRAFMEPRFGYDFSHDRMRIDRKAMESASGPPYSRETLCRTYSDKYNMCDDPESNCDKTKFQCGDPYPGGGPFSPIDVLAIDLCKSQGTSDINLCRLINGFPMVEDGVWLYEHGYSKKRPR